MRIIVKMKYGFLFLIKIYQLFVSPFQILFPGYGCRFYPSCSDYAYNSIKNYGTLKGARMGLVRILKCNPWTSS